MWARGYNAGSKEKPIIKQAYYLKYRLDGKQELKKIGIFAPKVVPGNKTKDLLTPAGKQWLWQRTSFLRQRQGMIISPKKSFWTLQQVNPSRD